MAKITCCGKELQLKKSKEGMWWTQCDCGKRGKGATEDQAELEFYRSIPGAKLPAAKNQFEVWASNNMNSLVTASATFINKPATMRMIKKNVEYIMNQNWPAVWKTENGVKSIISAMNESLWMGAILPSMGYIVPFGEKVEFIPRKEAFVFALTTGNNAPYSEIEAECIYENDVYTISRKGGNFSVDWDSIPAERGEVKAVVVSAVIQATGRSIGEVYTKDRLVEKAALHSASYKKYLKDVEDAEKKKSEGKNTESIKPSPYSGADLPEMLIKMALKSLFSKDLNMRNAREMASEWQECDMDSVVDIIDTAFERSKEQFVEREKAKTKPKKPEPAPKNEVEVIEQTGIEAEYIPLVEEPAGKPEQAEVLVDKI